MARVVLGLDIGGANLKAATADRRAVSVPFALWKQPDQLPAALAALVKQFPDATEFAVTMTGELCDCYETKREGVNAILDAAAFATNGRPVRVWSTDGAFVDVMEARRGYLKVAAANWHALATFAGRYAPIHGGLLIDVGSTTTDIIPIHYGVPNSTGHTDQERICSEELVYVGVRRTPVCAIWNGVWSRDFVAAELFATTQDVYTVLGHLPEEPDNRDTADGRPATVEYALARLARMLGGDTETLSRDELLNFAQRADGAIVKRISSAMYEAWIKTEDPPELRTVIVAGTGEGLAKRVAERALGWNNNRHQHPISLAIELGQEVSACAPAYALAVLATERIV